MPVIGRCDNEACRRESKARPHGIKYRIPAGWAVLADGPLKDRSFEALSCSPACTAALTAPLPNSVRSRLFIKIAAGEVEILPDFEGANCDYCAIVGIEDCHVHGTGAEATFVR